MLKKIIKKFIPRKTYSLFYKYKKRFQYFLTGVICPICKSTYEIFKTDGLKTRKNALCPNCKSLERHRLLWKYFHKDNQVFNKKNIKVLHFAPEKVFYDLFTESSNIEYFPVDLFPERYNFSDKVKIEKVDIINIPFEKNYFDLIICNHVLEHIPNDYLAMSELFRVLKKEDAFGIFQVPIDYSRRITYEDNNITDPEDREKAFGQHDHVRYYGRDYKDRLKSVGFKVIEDNYIDTFSKRKIFKYGLMKGELIYKCKIN